MANERELVLEYLEMLGEQVKEKDNVFLVKFNNPATKYYGTEKRFCFNKQQAKDIGAEHIDRKSRFFKDILGEILKSMNVFTGKISESPRHIEGHKKKSVKERTVFILDFEYSKTKKGMPEWSTETIVIDAETLGDVTELLPILVDKKIVDAEITFKRELINGVVSAGFEHLKERKKEDITYEDGEVEAERKGELEQRKKNLETEYKVLKREQRDKEERLADLKERIQNARSIEAELNYKKQLTAAQRTYDQFIIMRDKKTCDLEERFKRLAHQMDQWYVIERKATLLGIAAISFKEEQFIVDNNGTDILVRNSPFAKNLEYQCPNCDNFAEELLECTDHLICKHCSTVCICEQYVCKEHGRECRVCGATTCASCTVVCASCKRTVCKQHSKKTRTGTACLVCVKQCLYCEKEEAAFASCGLCNTKACALCIEPCTHCKKKSCPACRKPSETQPLCMVCGKNCDFCTKWAVTRKCSECKNSGCEDHTTVCKTCRTILCADHIQRCDACDEVSCSKHTNICKNCKKTYCQKHLSTEQCVFCMGLQPTTYGDLPKQIQTQVNENSKFASAKYLNKLLVHEKRFLKNKFEVYSLDKK